MADKICRLIEIHFPKDYLQFGCESPCRVEFPINNQCDYLSLKKHFISILKDYQILFSSDNELDLS
jgi:hypothetical protein